MLARVLKRVLPQPIRNRLEIVRAKMRVREAERAVAHFSRTSGRPHRLPGELIVSLTSYPPRYPTLAKTLKSLLAQDVWADRTILWLEEKDVSALPDDVRALTEVGLEVR